MKLFDKSGGISMLIYYPKARKLGLRSQRTALLTGKRTNLLSLEEAAGDIHRLKEISMGQEEIPLDEIAGTLTRLRARSFSRDFYPVLSEKSEFARKWENVYHYQDRQGISDPIKVYEYLRKYYVAEGNKRVSVLRYFGAVTVTADVYRLLPVRDGSPEVEIYYEFNDFSRASGINEIYFSARGRFRDLAGRMGEDCLNPWPEDKTSLLRNAYLTFADQYRTFGQKEEFTIGDAFLVFLDFYPLDSILSESTELLRARIGKLWGEFSAENLPSRQFTLKEGEGEYRPVFLRPSYSVEHPLRAAFLYDSDFRSSGWLYGHELGRNHVEGVFQGKVKTMMKNAVGSEEGLRQAIDQAVEEGAEVIFTASPAMMPGTSQAAIHYPHVRFLNCSLNLPSGAVRTYYSRMYEVKFLLGILAAQAAEDHRIAYLANYPIYGTISNINAFAIGASLIDPKARVYLRWNTLRVPDPEMEEEIKSISVISGHDLIKPERQTREYGLFLRKPNGTIVNLAAPVWNWGCYYEKILASVLDGSYDRRNGGSSRSFNYWFGLPSGVIDLILSPHLPDSSRRLAATFKKLIAEDSFHPFEDKITLQDQTSISADGRRLSRDEIISMNWLNQNVVGRIPSAEELSRHAMETAEVSALRR
jgi:basic membrane lipoprotein Med (substrate-binding protein (PBP1-ABC) superfamily)